MTQPFLRKIRVSLVRLFNTWIGTQVFTALILVSLSACQNSNSGNTKIDLKGISIDAKISIDGLAESVTGNTLQTVTYEWKFPSGYPEQKNLMVKVHFINDDNRVLFQDDHPLPSNTANQAYTRDVLIPLIPRPQNVRVMVGLFQKGSTEKLLVADINGVFKNKIEVKKFRVTPPLYVDDLPEARVAFGEGWHQKEFSKDQMDSWRWMSEEAHCRLKGADRDLILYIHGWVPEDRFKEKLTLTLTLKGNNIGTYEDLAGDFIIKLEVPNDQILAGETEELILTASNSFSPSEFHESDDNREMSAMIKKFYFN